MGGNALGGPQPPCAGREKMRKGYAADKIYERIFTAENEAGGRISSLGIKAYRTRTTRSGPVLEIEAYPIWSTRPKISAARGAANREAVERINHKNRVRHMTRLADANFGPGDISITKTYETAPDITGAQRDMRKFIRLARAECARRGTRLKYIYVIEGGADGKRVHQHMLLSGLDRDTAERIWQSVAAGRVNADRLQIDRHGLAALCAYMLKDRRRPGARRMRWACSRNLAKPETRVSDTRISRRRAAAIARDVDEAAHLIFTRLYPGYEYVEHAVKTSAYVSGAYIYAKLYRSGGGGWQGHT